MGNRVTRWWKGHSMNEKLMYLLIVALVMGIATRWRFVFGEAAEAFRHIFVS
ncbi:hypothetical protein [uncultured Rikenella sp.]|uniref:hypothetical protein n=1 Tax=uncultured Rikenella sp. TaxID=368003 RepID=UPI0025F457FF|nr:hypothetical protein [uncultured Rikenella sp.]